MFRNQLTQRMPVDLGMLVSASLPLYTYSTFVDSQYTQFSSDGYCPVQKCDPGYSVHENNYINDHHQSLHLQYCEVNNSLNHENSHKVSSSERDNAESSAKDISCSYVPLNNKLAEKKRVSFADDKGLALVEVRAIPESTYAASPKWTRNLLSFITGGLKPRAELIKEKQWKLSFDCPADNLSKLLEKLESNVVSLESTVVENEGQRSLKGKVKVKNITYQKEVMLRVTFDRWLSYEDFQCTYSESNDKDFNRQQPPTHYYDTFKFEITIPPSALRYEVVEFCICYKAEGKEYWDNNDGINYRLVTTPENSLNISNHVSQVSSNKKLISSRFPPLVEHFSTCPPKIDAWETLLSEQTYW